MLGGLARRTARPRGFQYHPRYHDPAADDARKRRLAFRRPSERRSHKTRQPAFIAVGLGLVVVWWLYVNADAVVGGTGALLEFFFGA
jgi:hypothetical protein